MVLLKIQNPDRGMPQEDVARAMERENG